MALDNLILGLLWRRFANFCRSLSASDLIWTVGGGALFRALPMFNAVSALRRAGLAAFGETGLWRLGGFAGLS